MEILWKIQPPPTKTLDEIFNFKHLNDSNRQRTDQESPVLEISFGPPTEDFESIWSSQKARKFCHVNFPHWGRFPKLYWYSAELSQNSYPIEYEYSIFGLSLLPEFCFRLTSGWLCKKGVNAGSKNLQKALTDSQPLPLLPVCANKQGGRALGGQAGASLARSSVWNFSILSFDS